MPLSNSRPTPLSLLCIIFSCFAFAVPAIAFHVQLTRPHSTPQLQPFATKYTPPWARVRNWIVETWWPFSYSIVHRDTLSSNHPLTSGPLNELLLSQYGGDIVLRFNISTQDEASNLAEASQILFLDVWEYTNDWVDIRLSQDVVPSLLGLLPQSLQHAHTPLMHGNDLARAIAHSYPSGVSLHVSTLRHRQRGSLKPALSCPQYAEPIAFFQDYRPLAVIDPWMRLMETLFPMLVEFITIGTSYEGRNISALRVGKNPDSSEKLLGPRKTLIVSAGSHAREWISTSTVNYVAYSLITSYGISSSITKLLDEFNLVFIPTLNPDGYAYTFSQDRLWRKNRQETSLPFCRGIDLDRSWDFMWDGETASDNPCSESFAGKAPFEAVESRYFAEWAKNETDNGNHEIVGLLDLHSYSQKILYPYSFSCSEHPPTLEDLEEMGNGLAKAIRFNNHARYEVVSACEGNTVIAKEGSKTLLPRMQSGGGSPLDWFYHELKVRHSYQIKLGDNGAYGFLLPKEYIVPTGEEVLRAVKFFGASLSSSAENEDTEAKYVTDSGISQQAMPGGVVDDAMDLTNDDPAKEDEVHEEIYDWDLRKRG